MTFRLFKESTKLEPIFLTVEYAGHSVTLEMADRLQTLVIWDEFTDNNWDFDDGIVDFMRKKMRHCDEYVEMFSSSSGSLIAFPEYP